VLDSHETASHEMDAYDSRDQSPYCPSRGSMVGVIRISVSVDYAT
jgi:hypothetical protein